MATYEDRIQEFQFPERVGRVRAKMEALTPEHIEDLDSNDPRSDGGLVERIGVLLDQVLVVTGGTDPRFLTSDLITDLANALDGLEGVVDAVGGIGAEDIPRSLNNEISGAAETLSLRLLTWPALDGEDWKEAAKGAALTYRKSVAAHLKSLTNEIQAGQSSATSLREQIDSLRTEAQTATQEGIDSFASRLAELEAKADGLVQRTAAAETTVQRSIDRADTALATYQEQFSAAQDQRQKDFQGEAKIVLDRILDDNKRTVEIANAKVQEIQKMVEDTGLLVSVFTADGTANEFKKEAEDQRKSADRWRWAAVGLGAAAVAVAVWLLIAAGGKDETWQEFAGKLTATVALGALASYAAQQSARHRHREESAKHQQLNIAAFEPFVRNLDEAERNATRARVADAIFLRPPNDLALAVPQTDENITFISRVFAETLNRISKS